jgi:hypothetical protein
MLQITPRDATSKGAERGEASEAYACIDSVEVWFPKHANKQEIGRYDRVDDCTRRDGELMGYRLMRNWPSLSPAWLRKLDLLTSTHHGVLHRVDTAVEMAPRLGRYEYIRNSGVLKWSPKQCMWQVGRTVYWQDESRRNRRNLVLYDDKPNRITGEVECVHFELRLIGAEVIRRQGFHKPSDLLRLNPQQLFEKHVKWSDAGAKHVEAMIRKEEEQERLAQGEELSPWMQQWLTNTPARVAYLAQALGLDRAQNVAGRTKRVDGLFVPCTLEWRGCKSQ